MATAARKEQLVECVLAGDTQTIERIRILAADGKPREVELEKPIPLLRSGVARSAVEISRDLIAEFTDEELRSAGLQRKGYAPEDVVQQASRRAITEMVELGYRPATPPAAATLFQKLGIRLSPLANRRLSGDFASWSESLLDLIRSRILVDGAIDRAALVRVKADAIFDATSSWSDIQSTLKLAGLESRMSTREELQAINMVLDRLTSSEASPAPGLDALADLVARVAAKRFDGAPEILSSLPEQPNIELFGGLVRLGVLDRADPRVPTALSWEELEKYVLGVYLPALKSLSEWASEVMGATFDPSSVTIQQDRDGYRLVPARLERDGVAVELDSLHTRERSAKWIDRPFDLFEAGRRAIQEKLTPRATLARSADPSLSKLLSDSTSKLALVEEVGSGARKHMIGGRWHARVVEQEGTKKTLVSFRLTGPAWRHVQSKLEGVKDEPVRFGLMGDARFDADDMFGSWRVIRSGSASLGISTASSQRAMQGYCGLMLDGDRNDERAIEAKVAELLGELPELPSSLHRMPHWEYAKTIPWRLPESDGQALEGCGHASAYSSKRADDCVDNGLLFFTHRVWNGLDTVPDLLKNGLRSVVRRHDEGSTAGGPSNSSDIEIGGGAGVYTRAATIQTMAASPYLLESIQPVLIIDPRISGRLDWYGHEKDKWGDTRTLGEGNLDPSFFQTLAEDGSTLANEVIFDDSIDGRFVTHVVVEDRQKKDALIELLAASGFEPAGKPLDEFVVLQTDLPRLCPASRWLHSREGFADALRKFEAGDTTALRYFYFTLRPDHETFRAAIGWLERQGTSHECVSPFMKAVGSYLPGELARIPSDSIKGFCGGLLEGRRSISSRGG